jgi:hypothetical protein
MAHAAGLSGEIPAMLFCRARTVLSIKIPPPRLVPGTRVFCRRRFHARSTRGCPAELVRGPKADGSRPATGSQSLDSSIKANCITRSVVRRGRYRAIEAIFRVGAAAPYFLQPDSHRGRKNRANVRWFTYNC